MVQSDPVRCLRSASLSWLRQPHSKMSRECQLTAHVLCPLGKVICHCVAFCPAAQRIGMAEAAATAPLVTRTQEAAMFQNHFSVYYIFPNIRTPSSDQCSPSVQLVCTQSERLCLSVMVNSGSNTTNNRSIHQVNINTL